MGRPRIEKTKAVMLYLSNLSSYEKLDDATFGKVVKAVMRTKQTGEATEMSELEQYIYDNLLAQVQEDEKRYLRGLEFDRKRKEAKVNTKNVEELDYNTKCQVWNDFKPLIYDNQGFAFPVDEIEGNFAANKYALQCKYELSEDYIDKLFERAIESLKPKEL